MGLEYNTISVINSLVSRTSFIISYTFGLLLLRPKLEAKYFPRKHFASLGKNVVI